MAVKGEEASSRPSAQPQQGQRGGWWDLQVDLAGSVESCYYRRRVRQKKVHVSISGSAESYYRRRVR